MISPLHSLAGVVAIGAVSFLVTGCGSNIGGSGGSGGGAACTPNLPSIEQTIFAESCAVTKCHLGGTKAAGSLDLSGDTAPLLVNVPSATCQGATLVVPGDAPGSFLYQKIAGTQKCGLSMPFDRKLPADQIACIETWIAGLTTGTGGTGGSTGGAGGSTGCEKCGGPTCLDLATDPSNCGACDNACAPDETCAGGECHCPGGGIACNGVCVDTMIDEKNCGACDNACAVGQTCVGGACTCGAASVSFSAAVQPILTASCATNGCHKGVMPAEGLNLTNGQSYSKLVNVTASQCADGRKRVLPGQPSESYLIDKLMNVDLCFGTQMPKQGTIPQAQIQTISDWICAGAPNN